MNKHTRRKRINSLKILRMLGITLALAFSMFFAMKTSANGSTNDSYVVITVNQGDTLWNISKKFNNSGDLERTIYDIMKFNNMEISDIYPGDQLKIPLEN